jgi:hypothetical protein
VAVGLGTDLDDPSAPQLPQSLGEQPPGQAGAPSAISLKVWQPTRMLRRMIMVQRSDRSSDDRAMGQYCP